MKRNVLNTMIASAFALSASSAIANIDLSALEQERDARIDAYNRAPISERAYAAQRAQEAVNAYNTAAHVIGGEMVAPHPAPVIAPAPSPAAPIIKPSYIAPQAAPLATPLSQAIPHAIEQAIPVKTPGKPVIPMEPKIPEPTAYVTPTKVPTMLKEQLAPAIPDAPVQLTPTRKPSEPAAPLAPVAPAVPTAPVYAAPQAAPAVPDEPAVPSYDEKAAAINQYRKAVDVYFRTEGGDHDIAGRFLDAATQGLADLGLTPADAKPASGQTLTSRAQGLYGQAGAAPSNQATDYDVVQDQATQAAAALANNAVSHTQTNAQGINTVGAQVAQNTSSIGKNAASIAQNTQATQQNAAAVQTLQQQQSAQQTTNGTFVTQTDFKNSQDGQDSKINILKTEKAEKTQVDQIDGRVTSVQSDVKNLQTTKADQTALDGVKTIAEKADTTSQTNTGEINTIKGQLGGFASTSSVTTLEQRVTTNEGGIKTVSDKVNDANTGLDTKISKNDFTKDQARQDSITDDHEKRITFNHQQTLTLEGEVQTNNIADIKRDTRMNGIDNAIQTEATTRSAAINRVDKDIAKKADQTALDTTNQSVSTNTSDIATLNTQVSTKVGQADVDKAVAIEDQKVAANTVAIAHEDAKVTANSKLIATNKQAIETETQLEAQHYSTLSAGVSTNAAGVAANRRDIDATHTQVQSNTRTLANHEKRITALEQQNNKMFSNMDKRLDENRDQANAGVSAALAASQIPQVSQNRDFSVGAGVGTYGDQQAVAVGFSARINERMVTKFAVTGDSQQNFGAAAGASYEW
ncbi:YadA-like family protein [Atlantibacter sp.]|uniref:YadA-like family protein n=1 Tax=Atlantibacter sp. TaxID=1903473 RepID=UPI0028AB4136|nr:YadA-like family protein [Atlantibacter sp.]